MLLAPEDGGAKFSRVFDWEDSLDTVSGKTVKAKQISVFDDTPIVDGRPCRIAHMMSRPYGEQQ